jgi:hypothetical protein
VTADDGYIVSGNRRRKLTTKGWKLCVKWMDPQLGGPEDLKSQTQLKLPNTQSAQNLFQNPLSHGGFYIEASYLTGS